MSDMQQAGDGTPGLFILSSRDRDGLARCAAEAGWQSLSARRTARAAQRFLASDALVLLVDLRNVAEPVALLTDLRDAVVAASGALVALVDEADISRVPALIAGGATHYLAAPVTPVSLAAVLASAAAHADRLAGGLGARGSRNAIQRSDSLGWRADANGKVTVTAALARALGMMETDCSVARLLRLVAPGDRAGLLCTVRAAIRRGTPTAFAHALSDAGGRRAVQHIHPFAGGVSGVVELSHGTDVAHARQRDYLTGLADRNAAIAWLDEALRAAEAIRPVVLLLAISQFDRLNAAYGQVAGDALLGRAARRIDRLVADMGHADALVARISGAEFLVALEDAGPERAALLAQRLVAEIGRPFNAGDHLIHLTTRCGIAEALTTDDPLRLLRRAGAALADARASSSGGIRMVRTARGSREVDGDRLEADLRLALSRGEIEVIFQPQYAADDDRISGVEALARWQHPDHGMLGAAALFAAAERSDFMLPLSAHIQRKALGLAAAWPCGLSGLRLSVNVTAADIAQADFVRDFLALVDACGFPRARLTVEITESGLIDDMAGAARLLEELRAAGLCVAIDDFGTGYSSLAYLKALPLDYLKIDRALAQDIAGSRRDRVIVRGVIQMAKSLGLQVIAEGVETERQRQLLVQEGCDYYQGFLRSPALGSDALAALVQR
jgi:diguanylate cyclase (GGDEF)-like protein